MKLVNRFSFLLFVFIAYAILGTVVIYVFYHHRWNDSIYTLGFCYGGLLKNMIELGEYKSQELFARPDIIFTSHRLPVIPYFIAFLSKLLHTQAIGWIAFIKNILSSILVAASFYIATKDKKLPDYIKLLGLLFMLTFPQLLVHGLELGIEEGYVIAVLALFWALMSQKNKPSKPEKIVFILTIPALFFVKNTFLYICPVLIFLQFLRFRDKKTTFWSILLLFIAVNVTAFFNYQHSHKFTYKYSLEGWNIYNGNCPRTMDYYPKYTIDLLDYINPLMPPPAIKTEWELDTFFKEKAYDFIVNNRLETLRRMVVKAFTVMVDIRPNGLQEGANYFDSPIKYVGAFYMLIFRILMWGGIVFAGFSIFNAKGQSKIYAWAYLFFIFSFYLPYVLAFGFERHIIPLVIPVLYSFFYFYDYFAPLKKPRIE